ncbi:hypothetical protein Pla52o_53930 [Novipirellula galeiformis]|uniref:Uncharacterized protein n=1 Tax=Novipirellula galeiformis TaxID=2528004 RepID=A0A5C6BZB7_9BACT|nr:hypothetical protein Pla52o_53930 [Novipirellula galeiformis]
MSGRSNDVSRAHVAERLSRLLEELSDAELDQLSRIMASDEGLCKGDPDSSLADECLAIVASDERTIIRLVRLRQLRFEEESLEVDLLNRVLDRGAFTRDADGMSFDQ